MKKFRVGIIGATGMVGQRLVSLLSEHPWFDLSALAASTSSAGKTYPEAVSGRWMMPSPMPEKVRGMKVLDAKEIGDVRELVDFVFCAVSLPKDETRELEEAYARAEVPVISNNSACRMLPDVPMIIPEINSEHAKVIPAQQKRLGCSRGFIVVKPNCSIQSFVPPLTPLMPFEMLEIIVSTYQAVGGAGRTMDSWPEMKDNVIPFIPGEEEKSEAEPLKIWGHLSPDKKGIVSLSAPVISAQCVRVPVSDGHLATVSVKFKKKPSREDILQIWKGYRTLPQELNLPSAPSPFLIYQEEADRPQTALDRDAGNGMAVVIGRLRKDPIMDWRFVCLSHNTLRGAAGGGVLTAELLCAQGFITHQ